MAWNFYFKDRSGAQNGPVSLEELAILAKSGRIAPDDLVWAEGGEAMAAAKYPELAAIFAQIAVAPAAAGALQSFFPVWGLFWRSIVFAIAVLLIIPAPWAGLWFYRWLAAHLVLPGGRRLSLETSLGECWYIFAGMGLVEYIGPAFAQQPRAQGAASLIALAASVFLTVRLIDWFCRSLRAEQGGLALAFEGGFWPYLGWVLLLAISTLTVIGWAWALKYMIRWLCSKVVGTHVFEFVGTGWNLLWRTLVVAFGFALLLPIPWALRWFAEWYVSQVVFTPRAAPRAQAMQAAA